MYISSSQNWGLVNSYHQLVASASQTPITVLLQGECAQHDSRYTETIAKGDMRTLPQITLPCLVRMCESIILSTYKSEVLGAIL